MRLSLVYANYCYLKYEGLLYLLTLKVHISSHYIHFHIVNTWWLPIQSMCLIWVVCNTIIEIICNVMLCLLSLNIIFTSSVGYVKYFLQPIYSSIWELLIMFLLISGIQTHHTMQIIPNQLPLNCRDLWYCPPWPDLTLGLANTTWRY